MGNSSKSLLIVGHDHNSNIIFVCVIMHNMVIEDEGPNNMEGFEHATTIQMHREENSQKS
jgi:hypothetical protein